MKNHSFLLVPDWPAPSNIHAFTTTRHGGVSKEPYADFNLAQHVGDDPQAVETNRQRLIKTLQLPDEPCWIRQTHSNIALSANHQHPEADATFTDQPDTVCVVLTADCLPILVCDRMGKQIAAIHAGWRGLQRGIIEATLTGMQIDPAELLAWFGPAIGPQAFEVGAEVRAEFEQLDAQHRNAFVPHNGRFLATIYQLAHNILQRAGVTAVYGGNYCTYSDPGQFYSYRRDGEATGRMASLIWRS